MTYLAFTMSLLRHISLHDSSLAKLIAKVEQIISRHREGF